MSRRHFLRALLLDDAADLELRNERNGRILARTLITAFDSASRKRGLLGRNSLPEDAALVIAPCNAVHTWFMHFAIDVVFVDRAGTIVRVAHEVRPSRIRISPRAFAVLELAAGAARMADARAGDRLMLVPCSSHSRNSC